MGCRSWSFVLWLFALATFWEAHATTFTVSTTNDSGGGSLRQAILSANATAGTNQIAFNIPGTGRRRIAPLSVLPNITRPVVLDGYTQPGSSSNTLSVGNNAVLLVELSGTNTAGNGLSIATSNCIVRGLAVNGWSGSGVSVAGAGGTIIQGNFLGLDVTGTTAVSNRHGVNLASGRNLVGGTTVAARNVISGNSIYGVQIYWPASSSNTVVGNYIGTDMTGTRSLPNGYDGVFMGYSSGNLIGGEQPGEGNLVSGNNRGIMVTGTNAVGNRILGNLVGTDATGLLDLGNIKTGVTLNGVSNVLGGASVGARNVISGNGGEGVRTDHDYSSGNRILGNHIGVDVRGTVVVSNASDGIVFYAGSNHTVGGLSPLARNLISGNTYGVNLRSESRAITVIGNWIGLDVTGTNGLGNRAAGIGVSSRYQNIIGGALPGAGNVISSNSYQGILLWGPASSNVVQGNFVGTDSSGSRAVPNANDGITVYASHGNRIGGTTAGAGNLISGNAYDGIRITTGSSNNIIQGNFIGTDASGMGDLGNGSSGIWISYASANTIGGMTPVTRNVISGNGIYGVGINVGSTANQILGNFIGTDVSGTVAISNSAQGVRIYGTNNIIGGFTPDSGNLIAGNGGTGVDLVSGSRSNLVAGNWIGIDATGTNRLTNLGAGVGISGSHGNTVGGTNTEARNVICGAIWEGIVFWSQSSNNIIQGNFIGTDFSGMNTVGNSMSGIAFHDSHRNLIGGAAPGAGNVLSGNQGSGISFWGAGCSNNVVQGNLIGVSADTTAALPNGNHGVNVSGATNNLIGGTAPGEGNVIAFNLHEGVCVYATNSQRITIRGNRIYGNGALGIDLTVSTAGAVTTNDTGDTDDGPNGRQNFPVLTSAETVGSTAIRGTLNSKPNTTYIVDFYANMVRDSTGYGEGEEYLGWIQLTTEDTGSQSFAFVPALPVIPGRWITATATDPDGNTSEFCLARQTVSTAVAPSILFHPTNQAVLPSSPVTFRVVAIGNAPLRYQWRFNGSSLLGATNTQHTLANPTLADKGSYSVVVSNAYGVATSQVATLFVGYPPSIANQPADANAARGSTAELCVVAAGTDLAYQWTKHGASVPGATNDCLRFASVRPSDAGDYQVMVSNPLASITSAAATLTVYSPPRLVRAVGYRWLTNCTVSFSSPLETSSAQTPANYRLLSYHGTNGPPVLTAVLTNGTNVLLTTEARIPGEDYLLVVNGVRDVSPLNLPVPANSTIGLDLEVVLLAPNSTHLWRYDESGTNRTATGWQLPDFAETNWPSGYAAFSQGPAPGEPGLPAGYTNRTYLTPPWSGGSPTAYFRTRFVLPEWSEGVTAQLTCVVDDGAVCYVNGTEIGRIRILPGQVDFNTPASSSPEPHRIDGPVSIASSNLIAGDNLLAVEVHQTETPSSDVLWGAEVTAILPRSPDGRIESPLRSGTIVAGDALRFSGSGRVPQVLGPPRFDWAFGDGRVSSLEDPSLVSFQVPGTNAVTLTASDNQGIRDPDPSTRDFLVVAAPTAVADFATRQLLLPADIAVSVPTPVSYVVENIGDAVVTGQAWKDVLYLSRDRYLDVNDQPLTSTVVSNEVPAGGMYTNTLTVSIPPVETGAWYLLLSANDEWQFLERHRLNNELAVATDLFLPVLTNGVPYSDTFTSAGEARYFRITVPAGQSLGLRLNGVGQAGVNELYARFGALPTRGTFDYRAAQPGASAQTLIAPAAAPGVWYVMVYGSAVSGSSSFVLEPIVSRFMVLGLTPEAAPNLGDAMLTVTGAGINATTIVNLIASNGVSYPAKSAEADSFTQLTALFDLASIPVGTYSVRVVTPGLGTNLFANAFEVQAQPYGAGASSILATADFDTDLIVPSQIGYHAVATIQVNYRNRSPFAIPAPLLLLTVSQKDREGAFLTVDSFRVKKGFWTAAPPESFQGFFSRIQLLASGKTAGILQPGESGSIPVYYTGWQKPWDFSYPPVTFTVYSTTADDTNAIAWSEFKDSMKPITLNDEQWQPVFENFTAQIGNTWGDYVNTLAGNAHYLGRLGLKVFDVDELLMLALQRANGPPVPPTLAGATDASVQAPGLPLVFSRTFPAGVADRWRVGPLGRGWYHNWEYSLQTARDGTVSISSPGGGLRTFQPDSRNNGYLSLVGDEATLAKLSGNGFSLQEKSGLVQVFLANGRLNYVQEPNGNRITVGYSGTLLTSLSHSSGQSLHFTYAGPGRLSSITGYSTPGLALYTNSFSYDAAFEHLTAAHYYDDRTTSYACDTTPGSRSRHALTQITTACCLNQYFTYDPFGRLESTSRDGGQERFTFANPQAGRVTITDAVGNTSQVYLDQWGSTRKAVNPLGESSRVIYDNAMRPVAQTDPAGYQSQFIYDSEGNVSRTIDAMGNNTRFTSRGPFGAMTSLADARGNVTLFDWTPTGNLKSTTYPDASVERFGYDAIGNLTSVTNRRGQVIRFRHDASGVLTNKLYEDGSQAIYQYSLRGNLTNAALLDAQGAVTEFTHFGYDQHDRMTSVTYPENRWLAFSYGASGRRASSEDQLGHRLLYYYDSAGRLQSITNETGAFVVFYEYDAAGRMQRKTVGNGMFTTYKYDSASRLLNQTNQLANGTAISWLHYTYDSRGRPTSLDTHYGRWTYGYDDLGQLARAILIATDSRIPNQDLSCEHDALGNRVRTVENGGTTFYLANNLNQYVRVGDTNYLFDLDGNLVAELKLSGAQVTTNALYVYDQQNRLTGMQRGLQSWTFCYDALGNRVSLAGNGLARRFVLDPVGLGNVVAEYDDGNFAAHYDYGGGLLSRIDTSDATAYFAIGEVGNVVRLVNASGVPENEYAYTPFGNPLLVTETVTNPFRFVGQLGVMCDSNGLSFMRARYFHKELGRFLSEDPIGLAAGDVNRYRYGHNSPNGIVDPSGLKGHGATTRKDPDGVCRMNTTVPKDNLIYPFLENHEMGHMKSPFYKPDACVSVFPNAAAANAEDAVMYQNMLRDASGRNDVPNEWKRFWQDLMNLAVDGRLTEVRNGDLRTTQKAQALEATGPDLPATPEASDQSDTAAPWDPNSKVGPAGFGHAGFVLATGSMPYRVDFENEPSATAPAQQVVIADQLAASLDWTTFEVAEVGFADEFIAVPPGSQHFETNLPYSYLGTNFTVQIEVGVRLDSGQAFASFRSIDLDSELPPPVNIGFLPPEDGTGRGQGHFSYTIKPMAGLPTGTQIRNVALISFDNQPAIATNQRDPHNPSAGIDPEKECLNTIDAGTPTSQVQPLPEQSGRTFPVAWAGQDDIGGSGVGFFDVYVTPDGTNWNRWLNRITNTSALFRGELGRSYAFCTLATDNVGNQEPSVLSIQASTQVSTNTPLLAALTDTAANVGSAFALTNKVTGGLSGDYHFWLGAGAPAGAEVNPTNGIFRWTPGCSQASRSYPITMWVADAAETNLMDATTFTVNVGECVVPSLGRFVLLAGDSGRVPVNLISSVPLTNLQMTLDGPAGRLTNFVLEPVVTQICDSAVVPLTNMLHLLGLSACSNQWLLGTQQVAWLNFTALSNQSSAFVTLQLDDTVGWQPDGTEVRNFAAQAVRVVVLGEEPLLEAVFDSNQLPALVLYSKPVSNVIVEATTALDYSALWQPTWQGPVSNLFIQLTPADPTNRTMFFRALRE